MRSLFNRLCVIIMVFTLPACSIFGDNGNTEIAPYVVINQEPPFGVRYYKQMVWVTTNMEGLDKARSPFFKLFDYISGDNNQEKEIPMTAPVFMDKGSDSVSKMSFVLPADYTMSETPLPTDSEVIIEEITDYTVATITFNGVLSQENIDKHKELLQKWIADQDLVIVGEAKIAGYNPPFTIPALRRNEVLIPIKAP